MSEALALSIDDTPSTHILDVLLGEPLETDATADRAQPRVLEVAQVFGDAVLDLKHFARGRAVSLGATLQKRLTGTRLVEDFFIPSSALPSPAWSLFEAHGDGWVCVVHPSWDGFIDGPHGRRAFATLGAMTSRGSDGLLRLPLAVDERAVIEVGTSIFVARAVHPSRRVPIIGASSIDYPLLGIAGFIGFVSMMLGVAFSQLPPPPKASTMAKIDDIVTLIPQRPQPAKAAAGPSGEKAKGPEGKAGEKDPTKVAKKLEKAPTDRDIATQSGVLGALANDADLTSMLGDSALNTQILSGVGSMIGARATQIGAGGLGARSAGFGGGGTAEGAGGLGLTGKGHGGGCSGALCGGDGRPGGGKPEGTLNLDSGGTVILGALDKSQIDAVIKRNLSQIRYCYQRELTKNPSLGGKVNVKFVIAKDGSVSSATTKTSTLANQTVESCINSRFMRFTFPEPRGGGIVVVSYPFLFAPG